MTSSCGVYPSSITDAQWTVLVGLLPAPGNQKGRGGRPERHDRRRVLDAIFYLVRGGLAWRALPAEFPPWQTVYAIFARWIANGAWQIVHDTLRDRTRVIAGRRAMPTAAIIDSQSVRAGVVVARTGPHARGFDAAKKVNGRKRHIAVDSNGSLLAVVVTAGSIQDRDGAHRLLALLRQRFSTITAAWADSAYTGRLLTWARDVLHLRVDIIKRTDKQHRFIVEPRRWVVERTFAWLFSYRRLIHDHERHTTTHETMIYIAMIMLMSRRLARTAAP